jgi:pyruvate/2-oxoglutarate/acetoin dehydrogenase E1 component
MTRQLGYGEAIREALDQALSIDPDVVVMGLGVPDPKGVFGSTLGLQERHGSNRVFDIPLSENAVTGVALGCATTGLRPVLVHQRVDFTLVSFEQIMNQLAKWRFMFGGRLSAPVVIRMVVGRGWGQGPQHSQSLQALFAHVPGLKVVMPTTPFDAKGMMISAIESNDPVVCLEHRWLYGIRDEVPPDYYRVPLDRARVMRSGTDVTLIGVSYMTLECLTAAEMLAGVGISAEVIDLRSIRPLDLETILDSVNRTGRLLTVDNGHVVGGISAEITASVVERSFDRLVAAPDRMGFPDHPTPTTPSLADGYYPLPHEIAETAARLVGIEQSFDPVDRGERRLDQPDPAYQGPF